LCRGPVVEAATTLRDKALLVLVLPPLSRLLSLHRRAFLPRRIFCEALVDNSMSTFEGKQPSQLTPGAAGVQCRVMVKTVKTIIVLTATLLVHEPTLIKEDCVLRLILSRFWQGFAYLVYLCICLEIGLQGFYYITAGDFLFRRVGLPIYVGEPYAGFGNRPGLSFEHRTNEFHARYYINNAGFRVPRPDVTYTLAKAPDIYRVMILGPSFAFGWAVDYELSFAAILQRLLQERGFAGDKKIEIINAGVPAMFPATQLIWFDQMGKGYAPELVIQFVYGSMANIGTTEPFAVVNDDGYLVPVHTTMALEWRERFKKLATVFYGWMFWTSLGSAVHSGDQSGNPLRTEPEIAAPTNFVSTHPEAREAINFYDKLTSVVRQAGARLLVVYVPLSYAVHREDESRWRLLGIRDIPRQMAFDAAFVRYLNECQIPSIDLTQRFRKSAHRIQRMYYWLDIHWTPAGNDAAALAVADYLTGRP
jgi:hypothetical protein